MKKAHSFALLFTFISSIFLAGTIYGIKKYVDSADQRRKANVTDFNVKTVRKVTQKKDNSKVKKKRKKMKRRMKQLKPVLSAGIKGASFGLESMELGSLDLDKDLLNADGDIIMDEDSVDQKPRVLSRTAAEFPEKALAANIFEGLVELRMLIDKEGKVKNAEVLESKPSGYFEETALAMVEDWKFEPASYRGKNVSIWAKQVVRFGN